eukprot:scaffold12057_cov133-Isochrysis_galbana.AAC.10
MNGILIARLSQSGVTRVRENERNSESRLEASTRGYSVATHRRPNMSAPPSLVKESTEPLDCLPACCCGEIWSPGWGVVNAVKHDKAMTSPRNATVSVQFSLSRRRPETDGALLLWSRSRALLRPSAAPPAARRNRLASVLRRKLVAPPS